MTEELKSSRIVSRAEYDEAIAGGKQIDEEVVFVVEPLEEPGPLTDDELERMVNEANQGG